MSYLNGLKLTPEKSRSKKLTLNLTCEVPKTQMKSHIKAKGIIEPLKKNPQH